ncbi:MAG TPA: CoA transferase [Anaerovoracaceae bacterium]|nr:CoA transferase [Anaerovoracaceae bacterium]
MLEGVKILSFTHFLQGPLAAQLLADFGADVIKIEPLRGAYERSFSAMDCYACDESIMHLSLNRNQRSLTVDLRTPEGREIIERLLPDTDVIIQNFRPGVLDKYGFGYDQLKEKYPRIVYCNITGYGGDGPYADRPGQDLLAQAASGLCSCTGRSDQPPVAIGTAVVDTHGAVLAAFAIASALMEQRRTGKGHKIDTCLLNAAMHMQIEAYGAYLFKGNLYDKIPSGSVSRAYDVPYGVYETADGYILISKTPVPKLREVFGDGLFGEFEEKDVFYRRADIDARVAEAVKKKTTDEWVKIFTEHNCWFSRILEYDEVVKDPQVIHNGMIMEMDHPVAGKVRVLGNPLKIDGENIPLRTYPPELGQHTEEILRSAGFSDGEIRSMAEKKCVSLYSGKRAGEVTE